MGNALVSIEFNLDLPEGVVEQLAGRPDDGSQEWHEHAWDAVERAVKDDPTRFMEHADADNAEVQVTM